MTKRERMQSIIIGALMTVIIVSVLVLDKLVLGGGV